LVAVDANNDEKRSESRYLRRIAEFRESSSFRTHIALRESGVCLAERPMPHPPPPIAAPGVNPFWGTNARACIIVVCRRTPCTTYNGVCAPSPRARGRPLPRRPARGERGSTQVHTHHHAGMDDRGCRGEQSNETAHTVCEKRDKQGSYNIYVYVYSGGWSCSPAPHSPPSAFPSAFAVGMAAVRVCLLFRLLPCLFLCMRACVRARVVWPATPARRPTHRHLNPVHP